MRTKQSFLYQLTNGAKATGWFYGILLIGIPVFLLIMHLFFGIVTPDFTVERVDDSITITADGETHTINAGEYVDEEFSQGLFLGGFETITIVFIFILGLVSFKPLFLFLSQNRFTRKSIFFGQLLTICAVSAFVALINIILNYITAALLNHFLGFSLFGISDIFPASANAASNPLIYWLLLFSLHLMTMTIGYFITIMFFRLNKLGKFIAAFSLVILGNLEIPFLVLKKPFTFMSVSPINFIIGSLIFFVLFAGGAWLLIRGATVRE